MAPSDTSDVSAVEQECQELRDQVKAAKASLDKERKVAANALADLKAARAESIAALDKLKSAELREQTLIGQLEEARKASIDAEQMAFAKVSKISAEAAELRRRVGEAATPADNSTLSESSAEALAREIKELRAKVDSKNKRIKELEGEVANLRKSPEQPKHKAPDYVPEDPNKKVATTSKPIEQKQSQFAAEEKEVAPAKRRSKSKGKDRPADARVDQSVLATVPTKPQATSSPKSPSINSQAVMSSKEPPAAPKAADVADSKAALEKVAKQASDKLAARIAALEEHRQVQEQLEKEQRAREEEEGREREQELLEKERQRQEDEERERIREEMRREQEEAAKQQQRVKAERFAEKKRMQEERERQVEEEKATLSAEDFEALQALRAEVEKEDDSDDDEGLDDELLLEREMRRAKKMEAAQKQEAAKKPLNFGQLLMQMEGMPMPNMDDVQEKVHSARRSELKEKLKAKRELTQFTGAHGGRRMKR
mmetsp:Transcript_34707/g.77901  ORF Transcript_34707/g.77901 Transcript_34707/m.77901 type:complete len:486 (+) Transcript_34707:97-1554(+)